VGDYVRAVWRCRHFWLSLVHMDLKLRYRGSWLGLGWSLLQPLGMSIILCAVFHRLFHKPIDHYGPFLIVGLTLWNFLMNTTVLGCQCFRTAEAYIRQYPAPLVIYPLRTVLGFAFHLLLGLTVSLLLTAVLHGIGSVPALLTLVPGLVLIFLLGWSLALLAGLATVHLPDTSHVVEVAFHGLFYLTPIIYEPEFFQGDTKFLRMLNWNPLVFFLRLLRDPIVEGRAPSSHTYLGAAIMVLVLAGIAALLLRRLEGRVIYHL
jgi:lipopolysaccharide transport system permease protein